MHTSENSSLILFTSLADQNEGLLIGIYMCICTPWIPAAAVQPRHSVCPVSCPWIPVYPFAGTGANKPRRSQPQHRALLHTPTHTSQSAPDTTVSPAVTLDLLVPTVANSSGGLTHSNTRILWLLWNLAPKTVILLAGQSSLIFASYRTLAYVLSLSVVAGTTAT